MGCCQLLHNRRCPPLRRCWWQVWSIFLFCLFSWIFMFWIECHVVCRHFESSKVGVMATPKAMRLHNRFNQGLGGEAALDANFVWKQIKLKINKMGPPSKFPEIVLSIPRQLLQEFQRLFQSLNFVFRYARVFPLWVDKCVLDHF